MNRTRDELLDALCEAVFGWYPWARREGRDALRQRLAAVLDAAGEQSCACGRNGQECVEYQRLRLGLCCPQCIHTPDSTRMRGK